MRNKKNLKAVDFFCGGGGMSYGMMKSGVKVLAGIDFEKACKETYESNIKDAKFILADVFKLREEDLAKELNLKKNDDDLILIGCSPCQFWTIINTDKKKSAESKSLLVEFRRFVEYFNPGYVVVENVPGVLRKKEESGLDSFIKWLESKKNGYKVHYDIHNVSDYGVPQNRRRFTLIASRISTEEIIPQKIKGEKVKVKDVIGLRNDFPKIKAGHIDKTDFLHTAPSLTEITTQRIKSVRKDGGSRLDFADNKELQLNCFIGRDNSFRDTFGRLWWDRPSPTITTKFFSVSNGRFVHPEENRALSLREGAVLQSFPKTYKFKGKSVSAIARLIGNAVPPVYAQKIGDAIIRSNNSAAN